MTAPHTLKHAIQYLERADKIKAESHFIVSDWRAMKYVGPRSPCRAFGAAKKALSAAGSLPEAISSLQKELRKQEAT